MNTTSYHLWLKPSGAAYDVLAGTIRDLAHGLDGPVFEPHITLLGHLDGTEQDHLRRTKELALQLQPFQVVLTEAGYRNEYFQCLFMRVQPTPLVMSSNARAAHAFHRAEETYMPHLSLVYGFYPEARKRGIISSLPPDLPTSFEARALYLIRAESTDPGDWHEIAAFPVTGPPHRVGSSLRESRVNAGSLFGHDSRFRIRKGQEAGTMLTHPILSRMPIELGDNLVLRFARPDEVDVLVDFNTTIFDERVSDWTRDLISGRHPTVHAEDFTVVEDTHAHRIVSSMCLISQSWAYGNIPFQTGRCELVGTDPSYRHRGLIRRQFDVIHARSAAKGELLQVITGLDWFYRQFGYEMGMKLWGSQCVDAVHLRKLEQADGEELHMRQAVAGDYAFIRDMYDTAIRGQLFAALRSPEQWNYEFKGRSRSNTRRREWLIVEGAAGEQLGYVQYLPCLASPQRPMLRIYQIEIKSGVSYLNVIFSLLRGLWLKGQTMIASGELPCDELRGLELALERDHPFYRALSRSLVGEIKSVPWYIRVPDMVAFLRKIRPALERHLIGTIAEAYSGEVKLNCFRSGLHLKFERGQIMAIESWFPGNVSDGDARLPESAFLQLVCGWRRFNELADNFAECWATHEASILLDRLFPPFNGKVWVLA